MIVPTIHPNGTSREQLVAQLTAVTGHLEAARKALKNACPNGRDYYPQGPDAMEQAVKRHDSWGWMLRKLTDEIVDLAEAIDGAEAGNG